jgi:hypothetical protein
MLRNNAKYAFPHPCIELLFKILIYLLPCEWNEIGKLTSHNNKIFLKNLLRDKLFEEIIVD